MTPAARLHAEMLGQLGLTEDQFKAMSPADQQKIEDKIRELIKQQAEKSSEKRTGLITDISA
jgi:ABC-type transporter MlaC component